jgi:PAS domain S-box-containing protein
MAGNVSALKFSPLGWNNPPAILRYGLAILSVIAVVALISLMDAYLPVAPHVSLFLCAVLFTTWFCGVRPGLLATTLSVPAFDYFFVPPFHSLALEVGQLPRFIIFLISLFFVWSVSAMARRSTGALVHARDELQRNNEALREREELMRVLTENANDFIRLHTTEGRSVYASPSVERLYGRLPTTMFEFVHPEDLEACRRWWEQAVAGEAGHLQWRVRDAGGNWRWLESSASRLQFKGRPHVLTVCRDITERIRVQEALQESEAKLKEAQRLAKIGYWERDLLSDRLTWSEETHRIFGLEPGRGISQAEFQEMIHPDDRQLQRQALNEALQGKRHYDVEYRIVLADGEVRFIHVWDEIAYDESGRPVRMFGTVQDITERKRAEERLRQIERELRLVIDTIPANVWCARPDGAVDFTNQRLLKEFGFSHQDLAGWNWTNVVHPEDVTGFVDKWRASLASGEPMESEARVRHSDGEYHWYLIRNVPLSDDAGKVVRWYGTGVDITERKRAEDALRESQQLLQLVLATLPVGVSVTDRAGDITLVNAASKRIWGDIIISGRQRWAQTEAFWHESGERIAPTEWASVRALSEGQTSLKELIDIETYDGRQKTIENSAAPVRNAEGLIVGAVIVNEDVTERVRAEEALRETNSKLELLLNTSPLPITSADASGRITSWNKAAERLFGWAAEEAVGRVCPTIPPEETEEYLELIRRVMRGETYVGLVLYRQKMDGGLLYCSVSVAPQRNSRGEPVGVTLIVEDVTERRRAEERLKRSNEELRALSARLHSVREEESARIAREIHDELGALLSSLKWDLEEIGEDVAGSTGTPPLAAMREKVGALITLTDNAVNTVRRIASELRPTALEEFGLAEAVRWHAEQFQARTGIEVRCDCPQDGTGLNREQATAIFRIVQEALTNVLRHAQATRVDIRMNKEGEHVVLTVSDNGRGITEAEKSEPKSLGLLGMRERVNLLGGDITIEGTESRGTVVTVRVPATG